MTTTQKINIRFANELKNTGDPMRAAFNVCTSIRDEVTAMAGEDQGIAAFHTTATVLARTIAGAVAK